jgi:glutamate 5-kinase
MCSCCFNSRRHPHQPCTTIHRGTIQLGQGCNRDSAHAQRKKYQNAQLEFCFPSRTDFAGYDVVLVSSGAVGVGCQRMNLVTRPTEIAKKQALAAVGQVHLMRYYEDLFSACGLVSDLSSSLKQRWTLCLSFLALHC